MKLIDALAIKATGWSDYKTKEIYKEAEMVICNHEQVLLGKNDIVTEWTEVEARIYSAIGLFEAAGTHEFLTEATIKLQEAANIYADWFEIERMDNEIDKILAKVYADELSRIEGVDQLLFLFNNIQKK